MGHEKIPRLVTIEMIKKSGLRVYINPAGDDTPGEPGVFYSRRSCGPYYRWSYDERTVEWHSSRVHPSFLALDAFRAATWKAIPSSLQARLDEHYLE